MSREWRQYLNDMVVSCEKISRYTIGMNQVAFTQNDVVYDAVL